MTTSIPPIQQQNVPIEGLFYYSEEQVIPENEMVSTGYSGSPIGNIRRIENVHGQVVGSPLFFISRNKQPRTNIGPLGELIGKWAYGGTFSFGKKSSEVLADLPEQIPMQLSEVFINGTKVKLKEPLQLSIQFEDNNYIASNDDLGLLAVSESRDVAVNEIQEEFSELWNEYVNCPDEELTDGAKRLKAKLKGLVE